MRSPRRSGGPTGSERSGSAWSTSLTNTWRSRSRSPLSARAHVSGGRQPLFKDELPDCVQHDLGSVRGKHVAGVSDTHESQAVRLQRGGKLFGVLNRYDRVEFTRQSQDWASDLVPSAPPATADFLIAAEVLCDVMPLRHSRYALGGQWALIV